MTPDQHGHHHLSTAEVRAAAQLIKEHDSLRLLTVGIDIGSSTSHLVFARIYLEREANALSSRYAVVDRTIEWRSPIVMTPFRSDKTIDADELHEFVHRCYTDAGLHREDVDSGAIILTGRAMRQRNARAIDERFASESGKFVCATAGHRLEAILAAHGSGAVALSQQRDAAAIHVDVGGGTTKIAVIDRGEILDAAALAVGGRLLSQDTSGSWSHVDRAAATVAAGLGIEPLAAEALDEAARTRIVEQLARQAVDRIVGAPIDPVGAKLQLTEPLDSNRYRSPQYFTFSGGVAEYIYGTETREFADIAPPLAAALVGELRARTSVPILNPTHSGTGSGIRATVAGASQFTVQVSGKTVHLKGDAKLPVHNIPVLHLDHLPEVLDEQAILHAFRRLALRQDRAPGDILALSFRWSGPPSYPRLATMARALARFAQTDGNARNQLLVIVSDADIGQSLGRILDREIGVTRSLVAIDSVELQNLEFVDIGAVIEPPGVIPIVVKSLILS